MGKRSIKENKSEYQIARESLDLTRAKAAELLNMSESKVEKMENGQVHPDDVLVMADAYKKPSLCNYYCSNDCPIGREYVPEVEVKDLPTVTLEIISLLGKLEDEKARLIDISVDGQISDDEREDFLEIQAQLERMSLAVDSLRAWVDEKLAQE